MIKIKANQSGTEVLTSAQFDNLAKILDLDLTADSDLAGSIRVLGNAYMDDVTELKRRYPNLNIEVIGENLVRFKDPEVLRILLANGVGSDGGITLDQVEKVTSIRTWFRQNKIITSFDELGLFSKIRKLDDFAFQSCANLKSIDLTNITNIGTATLSGTGMLDGYIINVPLLDTLASNVKDTNYQGVFSGSLIKGVLSLGKIQNIHGSVQYDDFRGCFWRCSNMRFAILPDTISYIGAQAFEKCSSLEILVLPSKSLPTLNHQNAFWSCTNELLKIFVDPTLYESGAYHADTNWLYVANRFTLAPIGGELWTEKFGSSRPFAYYDYLGIERPWVLSNGNIVFEDPNTKAFFGDITQEQAVATSSLPSGMTGNTSIEYFDELKLFTGVQIMASNQFKKCTNLKSVNLKNITKLGISTFDGCSELQTLGDTSNIEYCGDYAVFGDTTNLKEALNLPNAKTAGPNFSLVSVGFTGIADLGELTQVVYISDSPNMKYVVLPETFIKTTNKAFNNLPSLEFIISKAVTPPTLGSYSMSNINKLTAIFVPAGSVSDYKTANYWKNQATKIYAIGGPEWTAKFGSSDPDAYKEYIKNL